jgi:hypothetical protein
MATTVLARFASSVIATFICLAVAPRASAGPKVSFAHPVDAPIAGGPQFMAQRIEGLAASDTQFLAAWMSEVYDSGSLVMKATVEVARIDPSGAPIGQPIPLQVTDLYNRAQVASDGSAFLVVFGSLGGGQTEAFRVAADGSTSEVQGVLSSGLDPAVTFDGTHYLVIAPSGSGPTLHARRITAGGTPVGPSATDLGIEANAGFPVSVAFGDDQLLVAYASGGQNGLGPHDLHLLRLSPDLTPLAPPVPLAANIFGTVADRTRVTFGGGQFLVTWKESGGHRRTRVAADGTVLDPGGVAMPTYSASAFSDDLSSYLLFDGLTVRALSTDGAITTIGGTSAAEVDAREVACGAAGCVAAWSEPRFLEMSPSPEEYVSDVFATSLEGGPVPGDDHLLSRALGNRQRGGAAASDGQGFLVVWHDSRDDVADGDLWGVITDAEGVVQGSSFLVAGGAGKHGWPRAAFDGAHYVVTWEGEDDLTSSVQVSSSGVVLDPVPLPGVVNHPMAMVGGDGSVLLAWRDADQSIRGAFLTDGVLSPLAVPLAPAAGNVGQVALATDGAGYFLAWDSHGTDEILGARIDPAGVALDAPQSLIAQDVGLAAPTVAFDGVSYVVMSRAGGAIVDPSSGAVATLALDACCGLSLAYSGLTSVLAELGYASGLDADHIKYTRLAPGGEAIAPEHVALTEGNELALASNGKGDVLFAYDKFDKMLGARRMKVQHMLDEAPEPPTRGSGGAGGGGHGGGDAGGAASSAAGSASGPAGGTGAASSTAEPGLDTEPTGQDGCGCIVAGHQPARVPFAFAFVAAALVATRRRGRRTRPFG